MSNATTKGSTAVGPHPPHLAARFSASEILDGYRKQAFTPWDVIVDAIRGFCSPPTRDATWA